jgi:predicted metal-binding protein
MKDSLPQTGPVELLVCLTCRVKGASSDSARRPGAELHARLAEGLLPAGVRGRGVECLSNCERGCSIALRGPGRWSYVYGDIDPDQHLTALLDGAARYAAAADGLVPWRERPEHFRKHCIARIPPLDAADGETE